MPELPEVETVRRGLAPVIEGARILNVDQRRGDLRFPFHERFASRLVGRTITGLGRRAKYLLTDLDDGTVLVMHLGMSGSFRIETAAESGTPGEFYRDRSKDPRHDHVVFQLGDSAGTVRSNVVYNDPRRFGFMTLVPRDALDRHPLFAHLGIDPTGNALNGPILRTLFAGKVTSLKAALLDQRLIAGLGNIYVCEALHRAGLSPFRAAGTLAENAWQDGMAADRLAAAIHAVVAEAIAAGGSSLRDHRQADGTLGYFQHSFSVYDRAGRVCPSPGCGGTIERRMQNGRSTFYCGTCQI